MHYNNLNLIKGGLYMVKQTVSLQGDHHIKRISEIVQEASKFESKMALYTPTYNKKINLKDTLGLLSLSLQKGTEVTITAIGTDEQEAIAAIVNRL
jgi:phosphotransferase system HPr (HPr) family protein